MRIAVRQAPGGKNQTGYFSMKFGSPSIEEGEIPQDFSLFRPFQPRLKKASLPG